MTLTTQAELHVARHFLARRLIHPALAICLAAVLPISAEEPLQDNTSAQPLTEPLAEASSELVLENGDAVDVTYSEAFIRFLPAEEVANKSTVESISLAIMRNPELAEIFVAGLFAPPAAGGAEYNQNVQAQHADEEAASYDPDRIARLETSIAATILFGQLTEIQIVPDFRPPNFDNQTYNTTPRP